jgi:hypothetical protein
MVGNLEVRLVGPQFKPNYRWRSLWKEKYPLCTSLKRKGSLDKGENLSGPVPLRKSGS